MVAGFISERRPTSNRNPRPDCVGIRTRRHELNANLLFTWRRKMGVESSEQNGSMEILPVTITPESAAEGHCSGAVGQMEIVLAEGERIIVWSDVETTALSRVLKALARR
jgi:transposase